MLYFRRLRILGAASACCRPRQLGDQPVNSETARASIAWPARCSRHGSAAAALGAPLAPQAPATRPARCFGLSEPRPGRWAAAGSRIRSRRIFSKCEPPHTSPADSCTITTFADRPSCRREDAAEAATPSFRPKKKAGAEPHSRHRQGNADGKPATGRLCQPD
jgi:hypothetical protein